jgi:hypothetical protein
MLAPLSLSFFSRREREDPCKGLLDIEAVLGSDPRQVDTEDCAQLAQSWQKYPAGKVAAVKAEVNDPSTFALYIVEKLATSQTHSPKTRVELQR